MQYHVEIDQSIRIEQTHQATVLAFADGVQRTIRIPARVKRACQKKLRARGAKPGMIALRMFVAGLLVLLEGQLDYFASITIDTEYEGREGEIKGLLLRFVSKRLVNEAITFRQIGKKSPAHRVAWETHRGKRRPNKVVRLEELLRYA